MCLCVCSLSLNAHKLNAGQLNFHKPKRQQSSFSAFSEAGSTFLWDNFALTSAITYCTKWCCMLLVHLALPEEGDYWKGYIDWPFLWRWLVRMGRAGPGHRKTGSVSWCAWACCLLTTQLSIRLEQLVLLLSVVLVLPHRSVTRTVICSYLSCLLAVLFQPF